MLPNRRRSAQAGPRQRLGDVTATVSNRKPLKSPRKPLRQDAVRPKVPHHESLGPNGDLLQLSTHAAARPPPPENKRLSAIAETNRTSQRYSQSSASTNASVELQGKKRKSQIGPWLLGRSLGTGATARVRLARHVVTGQEAAIKIISRNVAKQHRSESVVVMDDLLAAEPRFVVEKRVPFNIEREILIMKLIQHPNVLRLYDVWENRGEIYLVLEFIQRGELYSHIMKHNGLDEAEAVRIFRQIIAALAHCHCFNLCHRDLKPENVLLDAEYNVRLADFGMATLRHNPRMKTSCGSPHYAAPEVVQGKTYDGELADLWSLGVILYVMLIGKHPFGTDCNLNASDPDIAEEELVKLLFQVVKAEFSVPGWIGDDAEDLIYRLLDPNPSKRIRIKDIWKHPLLNKYERHAQREGWLGDPLLDVTIKDCGGPLARSQIDLDVVSSLCMLWQTTSEDRILQQLRNEEPNFERLLYHRLLASRREQEENFQGAGIQASTSDYHHVGKRRQLWRSTTKASSHASGARQQSQFSIANVKRRQPSYRSGKTASEAETDRSYDPFRASKDQVIRAAGEGAKVTIVRDASARSNYARAANASNRALHPALARIRDETLSVYSSASSVSCAQDEHGNLRTLRHTGGTKRPPTRSSLSSSNHSYQSGRYKRRSASYKRGVSFAQFHRRSEGSYGPPTRPSAPSPIEMQYKYQDDAFASGSSMANSMTAAPVRSKKEKNSTAVRNSDGAESKRFSAYLNEEARQVSRELERYCDRAFRESSSELSPPVVSSQALFPDNCPPYASDGPIPPPRKSSVNQGGGQGIPLHGHSYRDRPLPDTPTPNLESLQRLRKLTEARQTIMNSAEGLTANSMISALRTVDDLIKQAEAEVQFEQRLRISSAPAPRTQRSQDFISVGLGGPRNVSEPTPSTRGQAQRDYGWGPEQTTIRVVNEGTNGSGARATPGTRSRESRSEQAQTSAYQRPHNPTSQPYRDAYGWNNSLRGRMGPHYLDSTLAPIQEEEKESGNALGRVLKDNKLRNWFRRSTNSSGSKGSSDNGPTPPEKDLPFHEDHDFGQLGARSVQPLNRDDGDISPTGAKYAAGRKRRGLLGFLSRRGSREEQAQMFVLDDSEDEDSIAQSSINSAGVYPRHNPPNGSALSVGDRVAARHVKFGETPTVVSPSGPPAQNWLARLLRPKPGKRTMALQASKALALKEIRGILRDWKPHGMRDIITDRATGTLWARVDVDNALHIKPVAIRIEFFTVLLHGRRHQLSVARFRQESGAKSSFTKVVKTMKGVLRGRGMLVTDRSKAVMMRRCLKQYDRQQ